MAQCPRCEQEMEHVTIEGLTLDTCFTCKGIWFDAEELMQAVSIDAMSLASLPFYGELRAEKEPAWEQPPAFCPRCSSPLEPRRFDKGLAVIIDACTLGHGFWLDQGELHRIKEFCSNVADIKEEAEFLDSEQRKKMMEKHRKSLKGFRITYGVPEPPSPLVLPPFGWF